MLPICGAGEGGTAGATIHVSLGDIPARVFYSLTPAFEPLRKEVAASFAAELSVLGLSADSLLLQLVWRHQGGESQCSDDASFARAWDDFGCSQGGVARLHVCCNLQQLSAAPEAQRTCVVCGEQFASRNRLMRHADQCWMSDPKGMLRDKKAQEHANAEEEEEEGMIVGEQKQAGLIGNAAWDAYYSVQGISRFEEVRGLMHAAASYCFRMVPNSPFGDAALHCLKLLDCTHMLRGKGAGLDDCCWALPSVGDGGWAVLAMAQQVGAIQRQEAASMLPPLMLDIKPHHYVADLCAAPGSKTLQILDLMSAGLEAGEVPSGLLVANDDNLGRCQAAVRRTRQHLVPAPLLWLCGDARSFPTLHNHSDGRVRGARKVRFDRVLCDVPCSGDGRLRRSPKGWAQWGPKHMLSHHYVQSAILKRGLTILRPGGKLLYSTCSMSPVENEAVVAAALDFFGTAQVRLLPIDGWSHAEGLTSWTVPSPHLNTPPHVSYSCPEDVDDPKLWCKNKGPLAATMFPPASGDVQAALRLCVRLTPTHGDFGGFFCALFERVAAGPAASVGRSKRSLQPQTPSVCAEKAAPAEGPTSKDANLSPREPPVDGICGREGDGGTQAAVKTTQRNPIPSLLRAPDTARLQKFLDWFGLLDDPAAAASQAVARFPSECVRQDPGMKGALVLASPSLCRLVLKQCCPHIVAGAMPLMGAPRPTEENTLGQDLNICGADVAEGAATILSVCATRQHLWLPRQSFLGLLGGGSVLCPGWGQSVAPFAVGAMIITLQNPRSDHGSGPRTVPSAPDTLCNASNPNPSLNPTPNSSDGPDSEPRLCIVANLTAAGALVASVAPALRHPMLRLLCRGAGGHDSEA